MDYRDTDRDTDRDRSRYAANERLIQERNGGFTGPPHEAEPDRSLVYLDFDGLDDDHHAALYQTLESLSRRLWGSASLVPLGSTEFVLQLEGWSTVRCEQLCRLLERAFRQGLERLGDDVRLRVRMAAAGNPQRVRRR